MNVGFLQTRRGHLTLQLAAFVLIILSWQAVFVLKVFPTSVIPAPIDVVSALSSLVPDPTLWAAIANTLLSALQGLTAAILVGVPIGMLTGRLQFAEKSLRFPIEFGRAFPAISMLPLLVLIIGTNNTMKSFVVFLAVVFPLIIQTQHGARRIDPAVYETIRAFRIPRRLAMTKVILPTAAPYIATGIKLAATVSVLVSLGCEVLVGAHGLGRELTQAQQSSASDFAFAYIFAAGALGFGINAAVGFGKDRLIRWNANDTEE